MNLSQFAKFQCIDIRNTVESHCPIFGQWKIPQVGSWVPYSEPTDLWQLRWHLLGQDVFQAHLAHFLLQTWNQPFLQEVLSSVSGKYNF